MSSFFELIRNSLPEAIGGLIVAVIMAIIAIGWRAYKKRKIKPDKTPDEVETSEDIFKKIRTIHGVRQLQELESNMELKQLPSGVYGYVTPWKLKMTDSDSMTLGRLKGGTAIAEIHKDMSGDLFLIGFVSQQSLLQLQDHSRESPIDVIVLFAPYMEFNNLFPIPLNRIISSKDKPIERDDNTSMVRCHMKIK